MGLRDCSWLDSKKASMVWLENGCYGGSKGRLGYVARVVADRSGGHGAYFAEHAVFDCALEISLIGLHSLGDWGFLLH